METVANNYIRSGDVASAAGLYTSLEHLNPKHSRMARLCRVLADPTSVPLPHRHTDICEALLSPYFIAETLAFGDASPEGIQKRFQRLAVHVHPDKNPHARAGDSFLRLAAVKEDALRLAEKRGGKSGGGSSDSGTPPPAASTERANGKGKHKSKAATAAEASRPAQSESPTIPDLRALKQTRITLKSLKRKDIDDDFEIFTAAHRARVGRAVGIDEIDDDIDAEPALASTAPSRMFNPRNVKPPPKRAPGGKARPHPSKAKAPAPQPPKPEPEAAPAPPPAPPKEDSRPTTGEVTSMGTSSNGLSTVSTAVAVIDDSEKPAFREQVNAVIADLVAIRNQRTTIRLSCDLSFEAYQREKKQTR